MSFRGRLVRSVLHEEQSRAEQHERGEEVSEGGHATRGKNDTHGACYRQQQQIASTARACEMP